jgi:hypothetical protein
MYFLKNLILLVYYYCTRSTLWHLQKCLQYILDSPPPSFSFILPLPFQQVLYQAVVGTHVSSFLRDYSILCNFEKVGEWVLVLCYTKKDLSNKIFCNHRSIAKCFVIFAVWYGDKYPQSGFWEALKMWLMWLINWNVHFISL